MIPLHENDLKQAIMPLLEKAVREIAEEEVQKAVAATERRVRERVGQIASVVFTNFSFERERSELTIRVQFPGGKEPGQ